MHVTGSWFKLIMFTLEIHHVRIRFARQTQWEVYRAKRRRTSQWEVPRPAKSIEQNECEHLNGKSRDQRLHPLARPLALAPSLALALERAAMYKRRQVLQEGH